MSSPVEVVEVTEVTPEVVAAFERLIPQLSRSNPPPSAAELAAMAAADASVVLVALDPDQGGAIVGSLTLALFRIPTGLRAWIEDVVVDEAVRGHGVGEALNREALDRAPCRGRPHGRPDLAPVAGGGQPPLPTPRLRRARHQRLPVRPHVKFHDAADWLKNGLLPTVVLVLGALLFVRFVRWVGSRYRANVDEQIRATIEAGRVVPEEIKRSRAVAEVLEWAAISLAYVVAGLLALRQLGVPLTTLVPPATVVGVALGFGAQQVVGDLLAGFFLFSERQFGIGDLVRLSRPGQPSGVTGTVEQLTLRVTKLRTVSGEYVVVPNSALRQVTNLSKDWSRVVLDIPVPATEDLDRAMSTLLEAAESLAEDEAWAGLLLGKPVVAGVETIEVGYVQLRLVVRTQAGRQFDVSRELRFAAPPPCAGRASWPRRCPTRRRPPHDPLRGAPGPRSAHPRPVPGAMVDGRSWPWPSSGSATSTSMCARRRRGPSRSRSSPRPPRPRPTETTGVHRDRPDVLGGPERVDDGRHGRVAELGDRGSRRSRRARPRPARRPGPPSGTAP